MKLDGAIFSLEQRSAGSCIDLAVVFLREHFWGIWRLVACFAVPSTVLTWWLVSRAEWTLNGCSLLFFLTCPFCGAVLVAAAGPRLFGEPFSAAKVFRALLSRLFLFSVLMVLIRLVTLVAAVFLIFPAYFVAARYGFLAEILFLEGCPAKRYETRLSDLMNETYTGLVGRLMTIVTFFSLATISLFVLVDLTSGTLFGFPILMGRLSSVAYFMVELETLLSSDPRVATTLVAVAWLVYPVTRLAWMFCYLDVRIRKEGWDVELDFRVEARRLEAST
jgi:hypothetical protein